MKAMLELWDYAVVFRYAKLSGKDGRLVAAIDMDTCGNVKARWVPSRVSACPKEQLPMHARPEQDLAAQNLDIFWTAHFAVQKMSKFRPGQNLDKIWTQFGQNLDRGVEPITEGF